MLSVSRVTLSLLATALSMAAMACGAPTIDGFTIAASPEAVTVSPGSSAIAVLTLTPSQPAKTPVSAAVGFFGLPGGVGTTPAEPTVTTASPTSLVISAAPGTPTGTSQVQVVGYAGLASSTTYITVTVAPAP